MRPQLSPAPGTRALRAGPVSVRLRWRSVSLVVAGLALLVLVVAVDLSRGSAQLGLGDVVAVLTGGGDRGARFVVTELRLPRTSTAVAVGALLGLSGALLQAFARNPLASPDILGVDRGAAAGAVVVILASTAAPSLAGPLSAVGVPLAAGAGALGTALLIYALAWRRGVQGARLVLIGIGIAAALQGLISWMLIGARLEWAAEAVRYLSGSLSGRGWEQVAQAGAALAVLLPLALVLGHRLDALVLGDDSARALGVGLQRSQLAVLLVSVAAAAAAVVACGPVGFVALLVPQVALRLAGRAARGRPPVLASAVLGAVLVVLADCVGRTSLGIDLLFTLPQEVPVGVVTSIVGAPYLIWLLVRRARERTV
ncbi:iron ABC transporter permease [Streptomyces sp. NP160]|nr:iron ABC transporter permease [Streptomyces sp. NP160]